MRGSKLNIVSGVSVCAPQVGCEENFKEEFWQYIDKIVQGIPAVS